MTQPKTYLFTPIAVVVVTLSTIVSTVRPNTFRPIHHKSQNPPTVQPSVIPQPQPPDITEILSLENAERSKLGSTPLVMDNRLTGSAQIKAQSMLVDGYDHIDSAGQHGYELAHNAIKECLRVSENLDAAQTASEAVREWLDSPTHAAAVRDPKLTLTGIAVVPYQDYYYIVQHFCSLTG